MLTSPQGAFISSQLPRTIPWLTEQAIAFLDTYLSSTPNPRVLEFGCGGSTVWLQSRVEQLVSVEHNPEWHTKVSVVVGDNVDLRLAGRPYHGICDGLPAEHFDLVLVDGRDRVRCAQSAIHVLKPGWVLMLDNAERAGYQPVFRLAAGWPRTDTVQEGPDSLGFHYPNWQTTWWVKP